MANNNAEDFLTPTGVSGYVSGTQLYKLQAADTGGPSGPIMLTWIDTQVSTINAPSIFGGPFTNLVILDTWFV